MQAKQTGLRVGVCGVGSFSRHFIPLFKAHPSVREVVLCDLDEEKLASRAKEFSIEMTYRSLDDLCETDVDCIAIFTQNWLHGPQAVQALRAGKDVYSAVPSAITMEEIRDLVDAVNESGRIYMIGETSYYYPNAIYCRKRFRDGDFGRVVYAEGEYYHDFDHGLYDVYKWRGGADWKKYAGSPPMYYPTHSVSMIVSVTGARANSVSALGWIDDHPDGLFRADRNIWHNRFSNESARFRMSDRSIARINEFRRIGHPGTCGLSMYGTRASFEEQSGFPDGVGKTRVWAEKEREKSIRLDEVLDCSGVAVEAADVGDAAGSAPGSRAGDREDASSGDDMAVVTSDDGTHLGVSAVHDVGRLPAAYIGMPNGHNGSHQFLIDDFVISCVERTLPPNNVWEAARYLVPGLIAHESALQEGTLLDVPDFGDPPESGKSWIRKSR